MSKAEYTFKTIVTKLVARDIYPGPTAINRARLGTHNGRENNINGRECRWRYEVLTSLGWRYVSPKVTKYKLSWWPPLTPRMLGAVE